MADMMEPWASRKFTGAATMPSYTQGVEEHVHFQVLGLGGKRCRGSVSYTHAMQASDLSLWKASVISGGDARSLMGEVQWL